MTNMKLLACSALVTSLLTLAPVHASNDTNNVPPAAPTVAPVVADDGKGKDEAVEPAIVKPAAPVAPLLSAADIMQLTDFIKTIKEFRQQVKQNGGNEADLMKEILKQGGIADDSLGLIKVIGQKLNIIVQSVKTTPGSRGAKCQSCCAKATEVTTFGADELKRIMPLLTKYMEVVEKVKADGQESSEEYIYEFISAGAMKDITFLLEFVDRYKAYEEQAKNPAPAPAARFALFKRKK